MHAIINIQAITMFVLIITCCHGDIWLRKLDNFYRLEYMNSSKSPYNEHKPIQVESPIYILTEKDIPGLNSHQYGYTAETCWQKCYNEGTLYFKLSISGISLS